MTNRKKLIQTSLYDLLIEVRKNTHTCPVFAVSGRHPEGYICYGCAVDETMCNRCLQSWLNEEEKQ